MKKKVLFSAVALLAASATFAQGNGMAGITEATNMVTSYFDFTIPTVSNWIIQAGGMGNMSRNINSAANKTGSGVGAVAGAATGNAGGRVGGKLIKSNQ